MNAIQVLYSISNFQLWLDQFSAETIGTNVFQTLLYPYIYVHFSTYVIQYWEASRGDWSSLVIIEKLTNIALVGHQSRLQYIDSRLIVIHHRQRDTNYIYYRTSVVPSARWKKLLQSIRPVKRAWPFVFKIEVGNTKSIVSKALHNIITQLGRLPNSKWLPTNWE